ncbi:MAG: hypothetical protein QNJ36_03135 [Calothrix sp. MO_167.B42]|nr:hypothetical protein [Calothrix sp. MO_167.B42]
MKNQFSPQYFYRSLESLHQQIDCLIQSSNYQTYINSKYARGLDHSLVDALQAIEQVRDAYVEQQEAEGVKFDL